MYDYRPNWTPLSPITVMNQIILENSPKNISADWLKIMFLSLDGDTELACAVNVVMAQAKRIYILIIKVNKLFFFLCNETTVNLY